MLLALDTSTRLAGIALYEGARGLIAECNWHSANRHTVELMPRAAQMLANAGATPTDLRAVAVALGPGSFTGLRVALAAAKAFALANGLPLVGMPTLDFVAYPHQEQSLPVVAVVQAGRERVCWAPYAHGPNGWQARAPFAVATIKDLVGTITQPTLFAGELRAADRAELARQLGALAHLLPPAVAMRRTGYLAEMAWARYAAGETDDLVSLSPLYLHEPAAPPKAGG